MLKLDINALHRRGALLEGAVTSMGGAAALSGQGGKLIAGLGVLHWRGHAIEWQHQPIVARNPPPSWGASSYRYRPKFLCPRCQAGAYHLFLTVNGFCCRRCAGHEYPSRVDRDQDAALHRRIAKLRRALGVTDLLAEPPPPPRAPRSRWLFYRRLMALRFAELTALGALEEFLSG